MLSHLCSTFLKYCFIQDLWSKIQGILTNDNIEIQQSYFTISFEVSLEKKRKKSIFNFIVLLVKYYIFVSKYKQQIPNINGFINLYNKPENLKNTLHFQRIKWMSIIKMAVNSDNLIFTY